MAKIGIMPEEDEDLGPAMEALSPSQRAFVRIYLDGTGKSAAESAKLAGYGTENSTSAIYAAIAMRLKSSKKIRAAMAEEFQNLAPTMAAKAAKALNDILTTAGHKDKAKVALALYERIAPTVQKIDIDVTHRVDHEAEAMNHLRSLKALGVARDRLVEVFGEFGLQRREKLLALETPKQTPVDVEFSEVEEEIIRIEDL